VSVLVVYDTGPKWGRGSSFKKIVRILNEGALYLLREEL